MGDNTLGWGKSATVDETDLRGSEWVDKKMEEEFWKNETTAQTKSKTRKIKITFSGHKENHSSAGL